MSLLEALVVLAVVALIGTLAYPRIEQASQTAVLRQAVTVLAEDMKRARATAIRSGDAVAVAPASGGRAYILPGQRMRPLPQGLSLDAGADSGAGIRFFPDGTSAGGRIIVTGERGNLAVAVAPTSGTVEIVRP